MSDENGFAEREHNESRLLACHLNDEGTRNDDAAAVDGSDFRNETRRTAYLVACDLHADGGEVYLDTVIPEVAKRIGTEWQIVRDQLIEVVSTDAFPALASQYARHVRRAAAVDRAMAKLYGAIGKLTNDPDADPLELLSSLPDPGDSIDRPAPITFTDTTVLLTEEIRQQFLIYNVMPAGQLGYIAGPAKAGKTTVLCDAALSIGTGTKFLGYFTVPQPGKVLVITGESGRANVQETINRQMLAKGITADDIAGQVQWCTDLPNLSDDATWTYLRRWIDRLQIPAVFFDPRYLLKIIPPDQSANLAGAGEALAKFAKLAIDTGCSPIIVDHSRKNLSPGRKYEPLELEDITGSGGCEAARFWVLINLAEERDPENQPGRSSLWFSTGGNAGHGGRWNVIVI